MSDLAAGLVPTGLYTYPYRPSQLGVIKARRYFIGDSYTRRLIEVLVDGAVGREGIQYIFKNDRAQEAWDNWRWNRSAPYERPDELPEGYGQGHPAGRRGILRAAL